MVKMNISDIQFTNLNATNTLSAFSQSCSDLLDKCEKACFEHRLFLTQGFTFRFNIVLFIFIILVIFRITLFEYFFSDFKYYQSIKNKIDIILLISGIFLFCDICIF